MKLGIKEENGSTFAYILVVMVVSFLLVAGLIQVTTAENNQVLYQTDYMKAYYIARAGAESMAMEMERMDNSYYQYFYDEEQIAVAEDMLDGIGEAKVSVKRVDEDGFYRITSVGTYEDVSATVKIMMEYRERSELDFGVYAKEEMEDVQLKKDGFIGDIGSGGDIIFNPLGDENQVSGTVSKYTTNNITITMPETNDLYDDLDRSGYFADISQAGIKLVKKQTPELTEEEIANFGEYGIDIEVRESMIISQWSQEYTGTVEVDTDSAEYYIQEGQDHEDTFALTTTNPEDEKEKWLVLYLEGEAVIQNKSMLKVSGDNNLMIIVEDGIKIAGTISVSNNNKIRVYVMEGLNDKKKEDDPDVEIFMNGLIGIEDHPELLTFYLNPSLVATIDTNPDFYGYIIGPESIINMKNGETKVYGGIYGRNVKLESEISFEQKDPYNSDVTLYKQMGIAYWE